MLVFSPHHNPIPVWERHGHYQKLSKLGRKGAVAMKQLHIREPWADLARGNDQQVVQDLLVRIQLLEARIRELEEMVNKENSRDREPVGV